jgi:hypothetical protein
MATPGLTDSQLMARRVTNVDLDDKLDKLNERLTVIETEAKVAKWVLRAIFALFASTLGKLIYSHWH